MSSGQITRHELAAENRRLRAQIAQLEDRLDHLSEPGNAAAGLKNTAQALAGAQELLQLTTQVVSDVVLISKADGRLTYVSQNVHLIFGHSYEDVQRHGEISFLLPADLYEPEELERHGEIANIECRVRDSIGRSRDLLVTVLETSAAAGHVLYVCRDVTERLRVESQLDLLRLSLDRQVEERTQELRESREKYRRLVENLRDEYIFYSTDSDGTLTYVSPSVSNILGYRPDQVVGRNWREFVDSQLPNYALLEELERQRLAGLPTPVYEAEAIDASGQTRLLETRDTQLRDSNGQLIASEGICKDITAQREAEVALRCARDELERRVAERTAELEATCQELRSSKQRYRSVVQDSPDFIVRWQGNGERVLVNQAYCRYLGQPESQLVGQSFFAPIIEADRLQLEARLRAVTPDQPVVVDELRATLPDGRVVWQRWSNHALFDGQGQLVEFQAVGSDTTVRRAAEEQVRERAVAESQLRSLSARELAVMRLVVAGDANKVIARKLELSIKTIEKHRSAVMRKLGVSSVPDLVKLALLADSQS